MLGQVGQIHPTGAAEPSQPAILSLATTVQQVFAAPGLPIEQRLCALMHQVGIALEFEIGVICRVSRHGAVDITMTTDATLPLARVSQKRLTGSLTEQLIRSRTPILLNGRADAQTCHLTDLSGTCPARFMGMPILFDGTVCGTMELSSPHAAQPFKATDQATAYFLATALATPLALLAGY